MKKIFLQLLLLFAAVSCVSLDIPPKNIITDDQLLTNEAGMKIYMARLYSSMPFEDFKYIAANGFSGQSWTSGLGYEGTGESVYRDSWSRSFTGETTALGGNAADPWWGSAFRLIREANHLIETLPEYKDNFAEPIYNDFIGQGYFVRAYSYTQMARRFGGVPIVKKEFKYPFEGEIEVPRSSEKDTWDAILEDYNTAIEYLGATSTFTNTAKKYVALAFKAEAMLYAGSVAKYNENVPGRLTGLGEKTGIRVIGFAADEWQTCSNKYFAEAYKAAKEVIESGQYALYMKSWKEGDKEAQYKNMDDMWRDLTSPENMLVIQYEYPNLTHGLDAYNSPWIYRSPLSAGSCPTEDFLELFDGFERDADGTIKTTDGGKVNGVPQGHYILYDKPMDFFANVEPRLRAYVIFPGDVFKNDVIDIRLGIYRGSEPISPVRDYYDYSHRGTFYNHQQNYSTELGNYKENNKNELTLYMDTNEHTVKVEYIDAKTGEKVSSWAAGENGPFLLNAEATMTGLYLRKYLDPNRALQDIGEGKSDQPFILMRYADVLLAAAEAAVELSIAGEPSPCGDDMLQVATESIQAIQRRAGANVITQKLAGTEASRNLVRKERRKELAFEHKSKWDIRRWRVIDEDNRGYFWGEYKDPSTNGLGNSFAFRGIYPFYSIESGKWFFDISFENRKTYSYSAVDYYFAIPGGEVVKSKFIDQQPNR